MKNLFFLVLLCIGFNASTYAQAPSYTDFEWDILRFGYVIPGGDGVSGGLAISGEPRYNLTDNLSIGLRGEFALFGSGDDSGNVDIGAAASYVLIGDYYFNTTSSKRPFAGFGIGSFDSGNVTITDGNGNETEFSAGSGFGVVPRVGYEFGHLRLSAEYNLLFKEGASNYLGIHLGITLFGGYDG